LKSESVAVSLELLNSGRFLSQVTTEGIREVGDNFSEPEGNQ